MIPNYHQNTVHAKMYILRVIHVYPYYSSLTRAIRSYLWFLLSPFALLTFSERVVNCVGLVLIPQYDININEVTRLTDVPVHNNVFFFTSRECIVFQPSYRKGK